MQARIVKHTALEQSEFSITRQSLVDSGPDLEVLHAVGGAEYRVAELSCMVDEAWREVLISRCKTGFVLCIHVI